MCFSSASIRPSRRPTARVRLSSPERSCEALCCSCEVSTFFSLRPYHVIHGRDVTHVTSSRKFLPQPSDVCRSVRYTPIILCYHRLYRLGELRLFRGERAGLLEAGNLVVVRANGLGPALRGSCLQIGNTLFHAPAIACIGAVWGGTQHRPDVYLPIVQKRRRSGLPSVRIHRWRDVQSITARLDGVPQRTAERLQPRAKQAAGSKVSCRRSPAIVRVLRGMQSRQRHLPHHAASRARERPASE